MKRICSQCGDPSDDAGKLDKETEVKVLVRLRQRDGVEVTLDDLRKLMEWHCHPCTVRIREEIKRRTAAHRAPSEDIRTAMKNLERRKTGKW